MIDLTRNARPSKLEMALERLRAIIAETDDGMPLPNRLALAQQLGVSRMTVERAVSELVREGCLSAQGGSGTYVRKTGAAGGPVSPRSRRDEKTWALILSSVTHFSYPQLIRGCEDFASGHGINLILCNTDNRIERRDEYLNKLMAGSASGIIIVPSRERGTNWRLFEAAHDAGVSIVTCNHQIPGFEFASVTTNFYQSGFLATNHLFDVGCRRIAFIATPHYSTVMQRYHGYLTALALRAPGAEPLVFHTRESESALSEASEADIADFLAAHGEVDGIFAFNDSVALTVYGAMKRLGLRPGRDVRVVGCDNTEVCGALYVPLSSLEFPNYEIGRSAAALMMRLRAGERADELPRITLGGRLVARESTLGGAEG